jgi:hypothetical protein
MTSIVNIHRRRRRSLHPADTRHDDAPSAERTQTASRKGFVAVMLKTIRLTWALAVILAIEIGDFLSVKIGRVR